MKDGPEVFAVGIDSYFSSDGSQNMDTSLMFAAEDAVKFAQNSRQYLDSNIQYLISDVRDSDIRPSRNNILSGLQKLGSTGKAHVPGIFYFSGHGIDTEGVFSFCPTDYRPEIPSDSSISIQTVVDTYSEKYPWSLILIDACRIAPEAGIQQNKLNLMPRTGFTVKDNLIIITACSHGQSALELSNVKTTKGSIFSIFFWDAVLDSLKNKQQLSVLELFTQIRDKVSIFTNEHFPDKPQVPCIYGPDYDRFHLISSSKLDGDCNQVG
ncbi:caspase family protein [Sphingorhabdus sp. Alg231-15]|uniref:caspase family protein n=1 Tax=Sphingorhabdus sp. Alg231-15 TaxID=1922222 RepID=UPI000D5529B9